MIQKTEIGGVILAGGKASRMEYRDKPLQLLRGQPLVEHVIRLAKPQTQKLVLSVNHHAQLYHSFQLPLVPDCEPGYHGPLLGIYSAMRWYLDSDTDRRIQFLACFAADVPVFPANVINELSIPLGNSNSGAAYVYHQGQSQPLFSLWRLSLAPRLFSAIQSGLYGPKLIFDSIDALAVTIEDSTPGAFFNVNSASDLDQAARVIE